MNYSNSNSIILTKILILCLTISILFYTTQINTSALEDTTPEVIHPNKPELNLAITFNKNPVTIGQKLIITITVKDTIADEPLSGVIIEGNMTLKNKKIILGKGETNKKGLILYTIPITSKINPGISSTFINAFLEGYDNKTEKQEFQILSYKNQFAIDFKMIELKDKNKNIIPVKLYIEVTNKSEQPISIYNLTSKFFIDDKFVIEKIHPKNDTDEPIAIIPSTITSPIILDVILKKSNLENYVYDIITTNQYLSTYLKYGLKGNLTINFENTNTPLKFDKKAEFLKYKNNDWKILSDD